MEIEEKKVFELVNKQYFFEDETTFIRTIRKSMT